MTDKKPAFELELTRVIDAPRARVYEAWTGEFASGPADQISTVVTFEEQGQKTKVHAHQTFHVMTPEIEHATQGAQQGWTMTLDQLEAFCSVRI